VHSSLGLEPFGNWFGRAQQQAASAQTMFAHAAIDEMSSNKLKNNSKGEVREYRSQF
jgi:hypothetical protein